MNLRPFVYSVLVAAAALSGAAEPRSEQPLQMAAPAASLDAAFHEAVLKCFHSYRYDDSAMRELLRQGVDVNARDAQGRTALFYINSFCPQKDLKAKLLIEAGADVNARDAQGLPPLLALPYVHDLRIPQQYSCAPIIRLLAEAGADLNACDSDGYTRIELMLRRGNLSLMDRECVMLLQQLGCAPRPEHLNK